MFTLGGNNPPMALCTSRYGLIVPTVSAPPHLHQRRQLQLWEAGGVPRGQVQEQHARDGGVHAAAPLRRHAHQHRDGGGVVLVGQVPEAGGGANALSYMWEWIGLSGDARFISWGRRHGAKMVLLAAEELV